MMGISAPRRVSNSLRLRTSSADWTKERARKSIPCSMAKATSSSSFSVTEGRLTRIPGRFMPRRLERSPPCKTRQWMSPLGSSLSTCNSTSPSSTSNRSPTFRSPAKPAKEMETRRVLPTIDSGVNTSLCSGARLIVPSSISPTRMRGPRRSPRMATGASSS